MKGKNLTQLKREKSLSRWKIAQNSEKEFWGEYTTESLLKECGEMYSKKAYALPKEWSRFIRINKNTKILQIGCGPEGVITHLSGGEKYSIDPLAEFYKERFDFDYDSIRLQKGVGEKLPFPDNYFDVVILINVLDHVHSPIQVLSEIKRVLKDKGIFHFENYVYQERFIQIAKIFGKFKEIFTKEIFNIHHPYMFTIKNIKSLISENFLIMHEEIGKDIGDYENFEELKKKKKESKKLTVKIPALFGLYGTINYVSICKKSK